MSILSTRRRLLALGAGGLAALSGCQSISPLDSRVPVRISVLNATSENYEVWIQLTRERGSDPLGESLLMGPRSLEVFELRVPRDAYRLTASVDNVAPVVKRAIDWNVGSASCSRTGVVTVAPGETGATLLMGAQSCDS
jgi:hypothetical protein